MAITIKTGIVTKRKNSTYVPTAELTNSYDVVLKDSCSDYAPTFFLNNPTNTFNDNYLKWDDWYYFITDVIREKNHAVTLRCKLDPLATYKANILASTQFVAYDTTANTELIDSRLSVKTTMTKQVAYGTSTFFEGGCVLVGIVGTNNTGVFALTPAQASTLLSDIADNWLDSPDMLEVPDVSDFNNWDDAIGVFVHNFTVGLRQLIATGKAPDCIKSCIYVPVEASKFSGTSVTVWLGDYNTGVTGKLLSSVAIANEVVNISIPWQFTDWRRNAPYTHVYLSLPYVGTIQLPNSEIMGLTSLSVEIHVSQDGSVFYNIEGGEGYGRLLRTGANCSSNFMIGASNINPLISSVGAASVAGAGVAAAVGAITTPAGAVAAGTAIISGTVAAITPLPSSSGSSGGGAYSDSALLSCFTMCHDTNVDPSTVSAFMGTPTMAVKSLSGLSGYVECKNASVAAPTSEDVIQEINNYLNGGVYLE